MENKKLRETHDFIGVEIKQKVEMKKVDDKLKFFDFCFSLKV
jgi:hypothetical protein